MEEQKEKKNFGKKLANWHDKYYKHLLIVTALVLILCLGYMAVFYSQNGDFIYKDISLTGGTTITLYSNVSSQEVISSLSDKLEELNTREIYDLVSNERKALVIETKSSSDDSKQILEEFLGYELNEENSSIEFTGSSLSESFYKQLLFAILIAFILMSLVIFLIFRIFVPSAAVVVSAFADILMTLVLVNILGIKVSTAGIVAFLMLIAYSVDTDILLTNRVLKRHDGSVNEKIFGAFKTGITMTLAAIVAVFSAWIVVRSFSQVLNQIFTILLIGLSFDIFNTWVTNASLLKWHEEREAKKRK